jgi:hypothetical protein
MSTEVAGEWRESFVLRARLRGVPGARIGEALAEVEAHCAESGETPDQAFGDPVAYAQSLADQLAPEVTARARLGWGRTALAAVCGIGAIVCLFNGVDAVAHGGRTLISTGSFLAVLVGAGYVVGFFAVAERLSRWGTRWLMSPLIAGGIVATALPPILLSNSMWVGPGWYGLVAAAVLFAVGWWALAPAAHPDRIIDPRTGAEPFPPPPWVLRLIRYGPLVFLAVAVILIVLLPGQG